LVAYPATGLEINMSVTDLSPGDIYILKRQLCHNLFVQVGVGTDCGIFLGTWENPKLLKPIFRVLINQKDLKRNWNKSGSINFIDGMHEYAVYSETDIGSEKYFKVTLENLDNRISIGKAEFMLLEPLAVWETSHVIDRLGEVI
jgi:hypothetical protein